MSNLNLPSRRSLLAGAGAALVASPGHALTPGQAVETIFGGGAPKWVLSGDGIRAAADIDFAGGRAFVNGVVTTPGAAVTVTRSTVGHTYDFAPDSNGNLHQFAANAPRITNLGLLCEDARQNFQTYSQDFTNAAWTAGGTVAPTIAINGPTSPDGSSLFNTMTCNTSGANSSYVYSNTPSLTSGVTYTFSVYAEQGTSTQSNLNIFNANAVFSTGAVTYTWSGGTISYSGGCNSGNSGVDVFPNGAIRLWTAQTAAASAAGRWGFGQQPGASTGVTSYFWGAQAECGGAGLGANAKTATSYIATTSAAVTRSYDSVRLAGVNYGGAFTFRVDLNSLRSFGTYPIAVNDAATGAQFLYFGSGGVEQSNSPSGLTTTSIGSLNAEIVATSASNSLGRSLAMNNGVIATDANVSTVPSKATGVQIGDYKNGGYSLNAFTRRFTAWPRRLSDASVAKNALNLTPMTDTQTNTINGGSNFGIWCANYPGSAKPWCCNSVVNGNPSLDRFELRNGDITEGDIPAGSHSERSEWGGSGQAQGASWWVAYSQYIVPGDSVGQGGNIIFQLHPSGYNVGDTYASTILLVQIYAGQMQFIANYSTSVPLTSSGQVTAVNVLNDSNFLTGQWVNWVHHFVTDPTGAAGVWQVWRNGTQIINYAGAVGFASCSTQYPKYGQYRTVAPQVGKSGISVVWDANFEAGLTDLTARIATPKPVPSFIPW